MEGMDPALHRHPDLPRPVESTASRLSWLRAGVLGANDGIVSTAALIVGVAASGASSGAILTAGVAALVAGALSMGVGEYVSVSSQRDSERAAIRRERRFLASNPVGQEAQLAHMYELRGLSPRTAHAVAAELSAADPLRAHLDIEYRLDEDESPNDPWSAAAASAAAFSLGALVPLLAVVLLPATWAPWSVLVAVVAALLLTGFTAARIGAAGKRRAMVRVLVGGVGALAITHAIGVLFGAHVV